MPMIREKALRNESLETNNAKDCLQSCGYLSKWTSFLLFRVRMPRMRDIALRNGTLDRNTVNGWNSRADISGNARHFCDGELNYTGYEAERQKPLRSKISTSHWSSSLAFLSHLHYHRTNKKKEFSICTKIAFVVIINVFIPGWL